MSVKNINKIKRIMNIKNSLYIDRTPFVKHIMKKSLEYPLVLMFKDWDDEIFYVRFYNLNVD